MGQIVQWPEVVTEAPTIEECRAMLEDALREMIAAHADRKMEPPLNKRSDIVPLLEIPGPRLVREGASHSIYSDGLHTISPKRHRSFDRTTANELCKQAGLSKWF